MTNVQFERRGAIGIIVLDRPKVLNALDQGMITAIRAAIEDWAEDDKVAAVVIRGEGERAFCAGGDIRAFYESAKAGDDTARRFWRDEYGLIARIKRYPKPYIALIHGICMGGGLGLSVPGAYRLADETLLCAMPETGIGFYPDVGASYFLSRAPGESGTYLALTGARIKLEDALYTGLVTHAVPQKKWPHVLAALASGDGPGDLLRSSRTDAENPPLQRHQALIDEMFSAGSLEEIYARLDASKDTFARETAALMRTRSPTSQKIALRALRAGRNLDMAECLRMDLRIASRIQAMPDFCEGIRATVIDKKSKPVWSPSTPEDIGDAELNACFAPLPEGDLEA